MTDATRPLPGPARPWYVLAAVVALFLVAGALRLNDLSLYTPDSIRYVIWGNSLAHGRGFVDDTQPEPQRFVEHAPLYAVLVAPVELFAPRSLLAVKIATLLWGALALVLTAVWFRRRLGDTAALAATILVAASPLLLVYSTEALSEAPFLAFLVAILLLAERDVAGEASSRAETALFLLLVGTIGLLREIGAAVVVAVVVYLFLRGRRARAAMAGGAAVLFFAAWYVRNQVLVPMPEGSIDANTSLIFQHFVTGEEASMAAEYLKRIWVDLQGYGWQLGGMLLYPLHGSGQVNLALSESDFPSLVRLLVVSVSVPLMALGAAADWRDRVRATFHLVLIAGYLLVVAVYPVHDIRFLFPLLPLMVYYIVRGATALPEYLPGARSLAKAAVLVPLLAFVIHPNILVSADIVGASMSYNKSPMGFYRELTAKPSYPMIYTYPWAPVESFLRDSVPSGVLIASPMKQIALVAGDRKVLEVSADLTVPLFERLIRDNGVEYVASKNRWQDYKYYEFLMKESARYRFDSVFSAGNLFLYKVTSRLRTGDDRPGTGLGAGVPDSVSASSLLRIGRSLFLQGDYGGAVQYSLLSATKAPGQPEPLFQAIAASSLMGDEARAEQWYQRLVTLPQASSVMFLARTHMEAMRVALSARNVPPTQERAIKMNDLARLYWNMGYRRFAERVADQSLKLDSAYFWGLLWGFHFNRLNGDRADVTRYLRQLDAIAGQNQVVVAFHRFLAIDDTLPRVTDPAVRAALHLEEGRLYQKIELFEEALDEAERALGADPGNAGARELMAEVFLSKGRELLADTKGPRSNGPLRLASRYFSEVVAADPANARARATADTLRALLANP